MAEKGKKTSPTETRGAAFALARRKFIDALGQRTSKINLPSQLFGLDYSNSPDGAHRARITQGEDLDCELIWREGGNFGFKARVKNRRVGRVFEASGEFSFVDEFLVNSQAGEIKNIVIRGTLVNGRRSISGVVIAGRKIDGFLPT